jgi:nitrous oxidase accessory protein
VWSATRALLAVSIATGSCAPVRRAAVIERQAGPARQESAPPRPAACRDVSPGEALQAAIDAVPDGGALCLAPATYPGPIAIRRRVTVWGPREAIIHTSAEGSAVTITGAGAALLGVTVDGAGRRYDLAEAGVRVERTEDVRVEDVRITNAAFGILVERAKRITVRNNLVEGTGEPSLGLRGDGIHLWEVEDSLVEGNDVRDSRDVVVWYSPRNRVLRNRVTGSRYGTHLMFARDATVTGNVFIRDEVGVFVMYSRNVRIERNVVAEAGGASGMAVGLKESGNVVVRENAFVHDSIGTFVDTSPFQPGDVDVFERNVYRLDDVAVLFHSSPRATVFRRNSFRDNGAQVRVDGAGDALGIEWHGNDFDDYAGYDLNGDGIGDVPYELRSLSADLTDGRPELAFFTGTPVLALVEAAGRALPIFAPRVIMRDPRPCVMPLSLGAFDED